MSMLKKVGAVLLSKAIGVLVNTWQGLISHGHDPVVANGLAGHDGERRRAVAREISANRERD